MSSEIIKYLEKIGRKTVEASYYAKIQDWYAWYQNGVDEWHKTTYFNGISVVNRNIKSLGMAKTVCETWALSLIHIFQALYQERINGR